MLKVRKQAEVKQEKLDTENNQKILNENITIEKIYDMIILYNVKAKSSDLENITEKFTQNTTLLYTEKAHIVFYMNCYCICYRD